MATYIELRQQAEKLMAEAEELRQKEIGQAIEDIKAKMAMYGLTAKDLGLASGVAKAPARKAPASSGNKKVKYRGPNGETWSGGRGRKPAWVQQLLKDGKSIEDYAV